MPTKIEEKIEELTDKFLRGNFYDVLAELDELLKESDINKKEQIKAKILKGRVLFFSSWFDYKRDNMEPSITILEEAYNESKEINNKLLEFESIYRMYLPLYGLNKYKEFNEFFEVLKKLTDEIKSLFPSKYVQIQAKFLIWKAFLSNFKMKLGMELSSTVIDEMMQSLEESMQINQKLGNQDEYNFNIRLLAMCYRNRGDIDLSLEFWEKSLEYVLDLENKYHIAFVYLRISEIYRIKRNFDLALEFMQKADNLYKELGSERGRYFSKYDKGEILFAKGEYENTQKIFEECLEFSLKENIRNMIAWCYEAIGTLIFLQWGRLEKALEHYMKAYRIYIESGDLKAPSILFKISEVHLLRGELDEALKIRKETLEYWKKVGNIFTITGYLSAIADVYWQKGMLEEAMKYAKECLKLREEKDLKVLIFFSLTQMTYLAVETKDQELSLQYLNQMETIKDELNTKGSDQDYRLLKALVLKLSTKIDDLIQAEVLLEQLLEEELNYYQLTYSILYLCEILIKQLLQTNDKEILKKLIAYVKKLYEFAETNKTYPLMVEVLWLQSQISLVEMDFEKAQELLSKANQMAKEKGLERLEKKIVYAESEISNKREEMVDLGDLDSTLPKRLEIVKLNGTIADIRKERLADIKQEEHFVQNKLFSIKL